MAPANQQMMYHASGDDMAHGVTISLRRSLDELRALNRTRESHEATALRAFDILRNAVRQ